MFSAEEIERYARHLVLAEVGGPGQQKLKAASVLVVGAGGLGAPVIQYLAAAGVGRLGVVDDDVVSRSNLQRQVLFDTASIGQGKSDSARDAVERLNPNVTVVGHPVRLDAGNADAILADYDIVADGSDNFETRFLVADRCAALEKPLVTAAVGRFDGSITTLLPWAETDGRANPGYRDIFPEPPPEGLLPTCAEVGILGSVVGLVGSLQATEVLKLILGIGAPLVGRLLLVDALSMRFETINYRRRP